MLSFLLFCAKHFHGFGGNDTPFVLVVANADAIAVASGKAIGINKCLLGIGFILLGGFIVPLQIPFMHLVHAEEDSGKPLRHIVLVEDVIANLDVDIAVHCLSTFQWVVLSEGKPTKARIDKPRHIALIVLVRHKLSAHPELVDIPNGFSIADFTIDIDDSSIRNVHSVLGKVRK